MHLDQLARALDAFRAHEPTHLYAHAIAVYLEVARKAPVTYEEIAETTGITTSSVSRIIESLGQENRNGRPGLNLVRTEKDPKEGRRYIAVLTAKGERLAHQLKGI